MFDQPLSFRGIKLHDAVLTHQRAASNLGRVGCRKELTRSYNAHELSSDVRELATDYPNKWQAERAGGRMKARRAKTRHRAGFGSRQLSAQRPANGLPVELTEPLDHPSWCNRLPGIKNRCFVKQVHTCTSKEGSNR